VKAGHKRHRKVDRQFRTFSPCQECVDFCLLGAARKLAVSRKLLAPIVSRRQFPNGCLPRPDDVGS
jgi:hypothetical protein